MSLLFCSFVLADVAPPPDDTSQPKDPSNSVYEVKSPSESVAPPPERGCAAAIVTAGLLALGATIIRRNPPLPQRATA